MHREGFNLLSYVDADPTPEVPSFAVHGVHPEKSQKTGPVARSWGAAMCAVVGVRDEDASLRAQSDEGIDLRRAAPRQQTRDDRCPGEQQGDRHKG